MGFGYIGGYYVVFVVRAVAQRFQYQKRKQNKKHSILSIFFCFCFVSFRAFLMYTMSYLLFCLSAMYCCCCCYYDELCYSIYLFTLIRIGIAFAGCNNNNKFTLACHRRRSTCTHIRIWSEMHAEIWVCATVCVFVCLSICVAANGRMCVCVVCGRLPVYECGTCRTECHLSFVLSCNSCTYLRT